MKKPNITVRYNNKEKSWEVQVDYGRYGRLFYYQADALVYAKELGDNRIFLEGEIGKQNGLRYIKGE